MASSRQGTILLPVHAPGPYLLGGKMPAMLTLICSELVSHRPQVAKAAAAACADSILSDVGITSLLKQMYCSPEWQQGQVTATLVRPSPMPCYIKQYFTPFMGSDGKWCQGVDKNAPDVKPAE